MTNTELSDAVREALDTVPAEVSHHGTHPPDPKDVYVVPGHEKALNPDTLIIVGDRGTGKSFWSAALHSETTRILINQQLRRINLRSTNVSWGFASEVGSQDYPSHRTLSDLVQKKKLLPDDIWRTVFLHQLFGRTSWGDGIENWEQRVRWVAENSEKAEARISEINANLRSEGRRHLIIFDALDRLGPDWFSIRQILVGLLRVCLDFRPFMSIRPKLFMRPDMFEDKGIWSFPDASKLHHGRVDLAWGRKDLYGLLWHFLANNLHSGSEFRQHCEKKFNLRFQKVESEQMTFFAVPEQLRVDETMQATVLNSIASTYMGRDHRRGKTYSWLTTHLSDAKGQVSPRSFLMALKEASKRSREQGAKEALHYEAIKRGVQEASRVRLKELEEDYKWIQTALNALNNMTVPCTPQEAKERWNQKDVMDSIVRPVKASEDHDKIYLPPHAISEAGSNEEREDGLIQTLIEIGVMNKLKDGRLNIPDLFRVAAGIGRKGGVRPIR